MGTTVYERRRPAASVIEHSLADSRQSVYWIDDLPEDAKRPRPRLEGAHVADLAVVGGGYTGLWTAVLAKRRDPDLRVILVEAKQVGWAASGRNGGFCEASLTHGRDNGLARWGGEIGELDRLGLANLDAIEASEAELGIEFEFERNGSLDVAVEPHQVEWLHEAAADAASRGDDSVRLLDEHQVRAEVDSPAYLGAVWNTRTSAILHPAKLAAELARVAEEAGVEIFEHSPVRRLDRADSTGAERLVTEHGRVDATRAVLATNVFPSLLKRNRLMTVPVYDYVLMTEPLSAEQRRAIGWANRQGVGDMANQFHYSRMTRDGRILYGGYDAVYHFGGRVRQRYERRPESFATLASHFFTTYPQLEGLRFTHRWAGAIDTSTQFTAFTGLAHDGRVAYASGFTGLGVASTRFMAETMLDLLAGRETERTALEMVRTRPLPFPPEPAASFGINATRWSLDRADHDRGRRNVLLRTLDALGLGVRLVTGVDGGPARLAAGAVTDAAALPLAHEPVTHDQVVAGAPTTGYAELDVSADGTRELGVWEMTPGAMRDIEADEVFLVIAGRATVEFVDPALPPIELSPGSIVRLDAGMRTVWTVHETLRKLYIAP